MARMTTIAIVCLVLALGSVGVAAQSPSASPQGTPAAVERIDLPDGWQPEGIASDGTALFVGSLADGAIWRADPATGTGDVWIPGGEGTVAVGLEYESGANRLWVAGGATGEVRVYDAASGDLLSAYPVEGAGFLNDVAVTSNGAYVTDSSAPSLVVIPIGPDGALAAPEDVGRLELSGAYEHVPDSFNLNGIVGTGDQLVAVQTASGSLYRIDPTSGEAAVVDTAGYAVTNGDGLEAHDGTLYVVRNRDGLVAVLDVADDLSSAQLRAELTSPDLDVPTTVALAADALWAANARFGTDAESDTEYWITRLPLADVAG